MIQSINYLSPIIDELAKRWPDNRTVNIVCHGHSVPSGYFATPSWTASAPIPISCTA